jgi:broad specificity phosphatase PhoE
VKLYAVRHGQSAWNLRGLCNDDPAKPGALTATGRAQAREAARQLAVAGLVGIRCSPLPRTRETAAIIGDLLGIRVEVAQPLRDIRSGFDGRPVADYLAAIAHDPLHAAPGGESLLDHAGRVNRYLDGLCRDEGGPLALVAHEETLRVVAARQHGVGLEACVGAHFPNGAIVALECRPPE